MFYQICCATEESNYTQTINSINRKAYKREGIIFTALPQGGKTKYRRDVRETAALQTIFYSTATSLSSREHLIGAEGEGACLKSPEARQVYIRPEPINTLTKINCP